MAATRAGGSTQLQMAATAATLFAGPLLIARDGGPSDDDYRVTAANLKQITYLTESASAGLVIRLVKWAADDLDGHGADDDGLPVGPVLKSFDQRARATRVRVGPGEGEIR